MSFYNDIKNLNITQPDLSFNLETSPIKINDPFAPKSIDAVGFNQSEYEDFAKSYLFFKELSNKKSGKKQNKVSQQKIALLKKQKAALIITYKDPKSNKEKDIIFRDYFEAPESLKIKKTEQNAVHKFPGGIKTTQYMGSFLEPISWEGTLRGADALIRYNLLEDLRKSHAIITLIYKTSHNLFSNNNKQQNNKTQKTNGIGNNYTIEQIECVINTLSYTHINQNKINYEIELEPHQKLGESKIGRTPAFADIPTLIGDIEEIVNEETKEKKTVEDYIENCLLIDQATIDEIKKSSPLYKKDRFKQFNSELIQESTNETGLHHNKVAGLPTGEKDEEGNDIRGEITYVPAMLSGVVTSINTTTVTDNSGSRQKTTWTSDIDTVTYEIVIKSKTSPGLGVKYYFSLDLKKGSSTIKYIIDTKIREHFENLLFQEVSVNQNLLPNDTDINEYYFEIVNKKYFMKSLIFTKNKPIIKIDDDPAVYYHIKERALIKQGLLKSNKGNRDKFIFQDSFPHDVAEEGLYENILSVKNTSLDQENKKIDKNYLQNRVIRLDDFKKVINADAGVITQTANESVKPIKESFIKPKNIKKPNITDELLSKNKNVFKHPEENVEKSLIDKFKEGWIEEQNLPKRAIK